MRLKRAAEPSTADVWAKYLRTRRRLYKDTLVERYVPLVRSIAEQLSARLPRTVDQDDLMGAGVFGLFKSVENFDPTRNAKFETYCRLRVRGAMIDFLRQQDWIPREARNRGHRLHEHILELEEKLGRRPTDLELARRLKMDLRSLRSALTELSFGSIVPMTATDTNRKNGSGESEGSDDRHTALLTNDEEPSDILHRREIYQVVEKQLTDVERRLVKAYYFDGLTLKAIGKKEGISESRVCQIHGRMLDRLAERLVSET